MRSAFAVAMGGVLLAASALFAATLHVCPDGSGDYPDLQAAIAAAASGDVIELCDGEFSGPDNVDLWFGEKNLTLRSLHGSDYTTLNFGWLEDHGGGFDEMTPHPGITLDPGTTTRIEGVRLTNAGTLAYEKGAVHAVGATVILDDVHIVGLRTGAMNGTGVFVEFGSLSAADCVFEFNKAWQRGGAIYGASSTLVLQDCMFRGNGSCAGDGGVVLMENGSIENCVFEHNRGRDCDSNPAGKVLVVTGRAEINNCRFTDNVDLSGGAGLIRSGADVVFTGCLFEGGLGESGGYVEVYGRTLFRDSVFRNNGSAWTGAAISGRGDLTLERCLFYDNYCYYPTSHDGAGAITMWAPTTMTVSGCTFERNGWNGGSSIAIGAGVTLSVERSILAFGGRADRPYGAIHCVGPPSSISVECSDIFGNAGGDWVGCVAGLNGTAGNISADPLFCAPEAGDYTLRPGSPCAPANSACGQIGAYGVGCGTTALDPTSWGQIKGMYR